MNSSFALFSLQCYASKAELEDRRMKIERWGDDLAVRLPVEVVETLDLREGEDIEVRVTDIRRLDMNRASRREDLVNRLLAVRPRLPADYKFDRDEANAR